MKLIIINAFLKQWLVDWLRTLKHCIVTIYPTLGLDVVVIEYPYGEKQQGYQCLSVLTPDHISMLFFT